MSEYMSKKINDEVTLSKAYKESDYTIKCSYSKELFGPGEMLLMAKEIDAIHAAIHEGDEREKEVEWKTCDSCFFSGGFYNGEAHCYRFPPTKADRHVSRGQRACGEHRPKE